MQCTTSLQPQPSDTSQPNPASTPAPQTPSLRHSNSTTPVASGSQVEPVAIPLQATANAKDTPSGSPTQAGWLGSLRRGPPQPAKIHEPQPSTISEGVSESTHMVLDHPSTLPAQVPSSKPPTLTGWFAKSFSSSPAPIQQQLSDQSIPPSPTPSLRVIEAPPTLSSAIPLPAAVTVNTAAARNMLNISLLGRSKMKAQEVVVAEDLGMALC